MGVFSGRQNLIGLELEALSILLHHWADPAIIEKREKEWDSKIPDFRSGVASGVVDSGELYKIEVEFIHNEVFWVRQAIEWTQLHRPVSDVEKWLAEVNVQCSYRTKTKRYAKIHRPFPISKISLKEIAKVVSKKKKFVEPAIIRAAANRLGISEKTIKNALAGKRKKDSRALYKLSNEQSLLVSLFLDVCSDSSDSIVLQNVRAKILKALYCSGCSILFIFYLVQTAHRLNSKIFLRDFDFSEIDKLCSDMPLHKKMISYSPFTRLCCRH
jgi:hypothetical protein